MRATINLADAREERIDAIIENHPMCVFLNLVAKDPHLAAKVLKRLEPKFAVAVMQGRMQASSAESVLDFLHEAIEYHHNKDRQRFAARRQS